MNKTRSISELLNGPSTLLEALRSSSRGADETLALIREGLPEKASRHVWGASVTGGTLTILVDSPAWASRVRYIIPDAQPGWGERLGLALERVIVRVRPKPAAGR